MLTFHLSTGSILLAIGLVALMALGQALSLYWLFRAYRLGQFKSAVEDGEKEIRRALLEAVREIKSTNAANSERVLQLTQQLQIVHNGIQHLVPHNMRDALDCVAKEHAKGLTDGYRVQIKELASRIELYQIWLRAMTGGNNDLAHAAMRGFPNGMPEDLVGRIEAEVSKRRNLTISGRQQPPAYSR